MVVERVETSMGAGEVIKSVEAYVKVAMDNIESDNPELRTYDELGGMVTVEVPANLIIMLDKIVPWMAKRVLMLGEKETKLEEIMDKIEEFSKDYSNSDDALEVADAAVDFYDNISYLLK